MNNPNSKPLPRTKLLSGILAISGLMLIFLTAPAFALAQTPQRVNISLKEFMINPNKVTVTQGQPVQFTITNNGTVEHNFKVEFPAQSIEQTLFATNLMPGETRTAEYTFPIAGDWEMYCPVSDHETEGMKGSLQVVAGAPGGMPATGAGESRTGGLLPLAMLGLALLAGGLLVRLRRESRQYN